MKESFIPRQIFDAMTKVVSCNSIVTRGSIDKTVRVDDIEYAITGSASSGKDGYISVDAYQVVDFLDYSGQTTPLTYSKHSDEICSGKRERSYDGLLVKYGVRQVVLTGEKVNFKPQPATATATATKKGEIKIKSFKGYDGGKSGDGTYQTLINHTPPHDVKIIPFAGLCGLTRHIRPARLNIINDLDTAVVEAWEKAVGDRAGFRLFNVDAIEYFLSGIARYFDTAGTFIYLDPPYIIETRKGQRPIYKCEMTVEQHRRLLELVKSFKHARVMISAYQNDLYDTELAAWHTHDFLSQTRGGLATERIYMNYKIGAELHDYSFIGKEYREREKLARIKKNFIKKLKRLEPQLRNAILTDIVPHKTEVLQVYAVTDCDRIPGDMSSQIVTTSTDPAPHKTAVEPVNFVTAEDFYNLSSLAKFCGARWKQRDLTALICEAGPV